MDSKQNSAEDIKSRLYVEEKLARHKEEFELGNSIVARGQFGILFMSGRLSNKTVATRHVDESGVFDFFIALMAELNSLKTLNPHPQILGLLGYYIDIGKREVTLAYEFCSNGNLLKMLRNSRPYYQHIFRKNKPVGHDRGEVPVILNFNNWNLLTWTLELTEAMEYLDHHNIVHGDLAARNILVTCNYNIKVCNFCLSKKLSSNTATYTHNYTKLILPMEWLAPESLQNEIFSLDTDIWSYGIVLWEIYSLGQVPYPFIGANENYLKCLLEGYRLEKPKWANDDIYQIMLKCWHQIPKKRPTFSIIRSLVLQQFHINFTRACE